VDARRSSSVRRRLNSRSSLASSALATARV
jgi:hypothetical protein